MPFMLKPFPTDCAYCIPRDKRVLRMPRLGECEKEMERRGPYCMVSSYQFTIFSSWSKNLIFPSTSPVTIILEKEGGRRDSDYEFWAWGLSCTLGLFFVGLQAVVVNKFKVNKSWKGKFLSLGLILGFIFFFFLLSTNFVEVNRKKFFSSWAKKKKKHILAIVYSGLKCNGLLCGWGHDSDGTVVHSHQLHAFLDVKHIIIACNNTSSLYVW